MAEPAPLPERRRPPERWCAFPCAGRVHHGDRGACGGGPDLFRMLLRPGACRGCGGCRWLFKYGFFLTFVHLFLGFIGLLFGEFSNDRLQPAHWF